MKQPAKKKEKKGEKSVKKTSSSKPEFPEDSPFDFGGLPARNLKKNLGC